MPRKQAKAKAPRVRRSVDDAMGQIEALAAEIRYRGLRVELDVTKLRAKPGAHWAVAMFDKLIGTLAVNVTIPATPKR